MEVTQILKDKIEIEFKQLFFKRFRLHKEKTKYATLMLKYSYNIIINYKVTIILYTNISPMLDALIDFVHFYNY